MILEPAPADSLQTDALKLFLGLMPMRVIGQPVRPTLADSQSQPLRDVIRSFLVLGCSDAETMGSKLPLQLRQCHDRLAPEGRVAVIFANRAHHSIAAMRSLLTRGRGSAIECRAGESLALGAVRRMLVSIGFYNIEAFAVSPSAGEPVEIVPLSTARSWRAPAILLTASRNGDGGSFMLHRVIEAVIREKNPGAQCSAIRLLRVINSSRGKSVAHFQVGGKRYVIRIARSAAMLADEGESYDLLERLQKNPEVRDRIPRVLGTMQQGDHAFFAQTHLNGKPLSSVLSASNRGEYLTEVDRFLRELNPSLESQPAVPLDGDVARGLFSPMVEFALGHVSDEALRRKAARALEDSLKGTVGRLGVVHGDLGPGNILVDGPRLTGVVDWEAARSLGPPVLDAINYLDSAHRCCAKNVSIADTLALVVAGDWPVHGELSVLKKFFEFCGTDFRSRRGLALLYALFHFGPQLRFAKWDQSPIRRMEQVLRRLVAQ